jgi:phospholipase A1
VTGTTRLILAVLLALSSTGAAGGTVWADQAAPPGSPPGTASTGAPEAPPPDSALERRLDHETRATESRFSILPHRPNYLLPATWNASPNYGVYAGTTSPDDYLGHAEVKFQISIKTPLWDNVLGPRARGTLYAAYSQLALWQAYNTRSSSPFREINYEPELFLAFRTGRTLMGVTSRLVAVGFNHQSNGRSEPLSRSWNRIVASMVFNRGDSYVILRPWFRIPEREKDDDNPAMDRFYGYGELVLLRKLSEHTLTVTLRNNLRASGNKGAVQADWSFPLHLGLKAYAQYFNGYGESLVDYDHSTNRIGIGVMLTDWL